VVTPEPHRATSVDDIGSLWERVHGALADDIEHGRLPPNARLPSERDLSRRFAVSRVTVRRALAELAREGRVTTSTGLGWFVRAAQVEEPPNELVSFRRMGESLGLPVTARVLLAQHRQATLDEAAALSIAPGAELIELERLRFLDGVPIVIDCSLIPAARAPTLLEHDFTRESLYDALAESHGIIAASADYVVQARAADDHAAELLDLEPGEPVLAAEQLTIDIARRPFQLSRMTYRGDRYRFRTTLRIATPRVTHHNAVTP
jgi:GntR family transcriptional regulator